MTEAQQWTLVVVGVLAFLANALHIVAPRTPVTWDDKLDLVVQTAVREALKAAAEDTKP